MEIAILVVFLAIFSGLLFLALLIWFFFRRRKSGLQKRNFSSGSNSTVYSNSSVDNDTRFEVASTGSYFDNSTLNTNYPDSSPSVFESANQSEAVQLNSEHNHSSHAAAPDYSYSETATGYDSGSSSDSSSSSSSDSGSSDSGSSWSSD